MPFKYRTVPRFASADKHKIASYPAKATRGYIIANRLTRHENEVKNHSMAVIFGVRLLLILDVILPSGQTSHTLSELSFLQLQLNIDYKKKTLTIF